jgi:poly(3-hydroxybutyrate) depolymerase
MANVMLATYHEVFAAGAIIGGLPYGVASSVGQAFERMKGRNPPSVAMLRSALVKASPKTGVKPRISIWHGTHDQVVRPINAEQIAAQWAADHAMSGTPEIVDIGSGHVRKTWRSTGFGADVEMYLIAGMGHGVPLSSGAQHPLGNLGPFMLESGISSTARIARSWGLVDDAYVASAVGAGHPTLHRPITEGFEGVIAKAMESARTKASARRSADRAGRSKAVSDVINDALRAAGLMR